MLTWSDLLVDLRTDMQDNLSNPKLGAEQALLYARMAVRDYSRWNPRLLSATLTVSSTGSAPLPDDFLNILEVRDSDNDLVLPLVGVSNPPVFALTVRQYRWWIEGSTLRLNTWGTIDPVAILYKAYHVLPQAEGSSTTAMTFPDADEEAILLYIRAKHAGSVRSKTSRSDRYKRRVDAGNTRQDNPLTPEEQNLMDEYLAFMSSRYGSVGSIRLVRQRK